MDYGSLDALVEQADSVSGKVGENLRASLDQLALSRELATIKCDAPWNMGPDALMVSAPDDEALRKLYADLEFKTLVSELGG